MKKFITVILLTTTLMLLSSINLFAQTRISFRRGSSSATVSGTIPAKGSRSYVVRAGSGQYASVSVSPRNLYISTPEAPKGETGSSSFDTRYGDNYVELYNPTNHPISYRMTISIR